MVFLREGLDKIMLTVREDDIDGTEYPYSQDIAMKFADRIVRLKFRNRFGNTIFMEKYPWQSWKYLGHRKHTYAVQYYMRIDGFRQMRVSINCQRLYNIQNNLMLYDKRLFDDNVVLPSVPYTLHEFVSMVKKEISLIKEDYVRLRKEIFGQDIPLDTVVVDTHQIEMVQEGIGVHTSDLSDTFRKFSTANTIVVYHEQTNTHYFNQSSKRQLKMYQKGVSICRLEATVNYRPSDIVWAWQDGAVEHITRSLQAEFDEVMKDSGIPVDWYKIRKMSSDKFAWSLADAIGLRNPNNPDDDSDNGEVLDQLMKVLLHINSWKSTRDTEKMTRRLRRKGLIEPMSRGMYVPTKRLLFLQELNDRLKRSEKW